MLQQLRAFALDLGGSTLEDPTDLEIVVVDQNDNRPAFVREVFVGRVLEGAAPGEAAQRGCGRSHADAGPQAQAGLEGAMPVGAAPRVLRSLPGARGVSGGPAPRTSSAAFGCPRRWQRSEGRSSLCHSACFPSGPCFFTVYKLQENRELFTLPCLTRGSFRPQGRWAGASRRLWPQREQGWQSPVADLQWLTSPPLGRHAASGAPGGARAWRCVGCVHGSVGVGAQAYGHA